GGEIRAGITPAVGAVIQLLATEPGAAEFVLVAPLARLKTESLLASSSRREWRPGNVGRAGPDAMEPRAGRSDVIVHLPAGAQAVPFIGRADGLDDLAAHGVTEIAEAVEGSQGAPGPAEPTRGFLRSAGHLGGRRPRVREGSLFVPGSVGRGTGQAMARVGVERRKQVVQPARSDPGAALEKDNHPGGCLPRQAVEAGRHAERLGRAVLRQAG